MECTTTFLIILPLIAVTAAVASLAYAIINRQRREKVISDLTREISEQKIKMKSLEHRLSRNEAELVERNKSITRLMAEKEEKERTIAESQAKILRLNEELERSYLELNKKEMKICQLKEKLQGQGANNGISAEEIERKVGILRTELEEKYQSLDQKVKNLEKEYKASREKTV